MTQLSLLDLLPADHHTTVFPEVRWSVHEIAPRVYERRPYVWWRWSCTCTPQPPDACWSHEVLARRMADDHLQQVMDRPD